MDTFVWFWRNKNKTVCLRFHLKKFFYQNYSSNYVFNILIILHLCFSLFLPLFENRLLSFRWTWLIHMYLSRYVIKASLQNLQSWLLSWVYSQGFSPEFTVMASLQNLQSWLLSRVCGLQSLQSGLLSRIYSQGFSPEFTVSRVYSHGFSP